MKKISKDNNFIYLLCALIAFLLLGAIVEQMQFSFGKQLIPVSTVVMIAIAVGSIRETKWQFWAMIALLGVISIIVVTGIVLELTGLRIIHMFIMLGFFIWATWLAAHQVLFTGSIDRHKIIGAICIYFLLGLIWAVMYLLIAEVVPDAFHGLQQAAWYDNFSTLSYYSFVTLTTLGYGDISPRLAIPQFLAYMEAIVGVFYIAILVASLIGASLSERHANNQNPK